MEKILKLLEKDATLTAETIAVMLGADEAAVAATIDTYKKQGCLFS